MRVEDYTMMDTSTSKQDNDFSKEVDDKLAQLKGLDVKQNFLTILDSLYGLEKTTRLGGDAISTGRVLVAIVQLCHNAENWNALNENILIFVKKRSQLKQSIVCMIKESMNFIEQMPNKEEKMRLIDTLRTATEGKIYVENERARISKILAEIKEKDGDIASAAKILEEVQVDTFGTMEKKEKVEFILEQMRLLIENEDLIKAQIVAKKINIKFFADMQYVDLKFRYYDLMIRMDQESSFLRTSKHYQAIVDTDTEILTTERRQRMMVCAILYCILSPYDNEQSDMMNRLSKNKIVEDLPLYKHLLGLFLSKELIDWGALNSQYKSELTALPVFDTNTKHGIKCWKELRTRVIEYNIRIISNYYTRIYLNRLSELLGLNESETEKHLSNLIVAGTIEAKIDRLSGIVNFIVHRDANEKLNLWSNGLQDLMKLIDKTSHLIEKEDCVQRALFMAENN